MSTPANNLTTKQRIGDKANSWFEKNRSLALRQTPKWAQGITLTFISLGGILIVGSFIFRIDEVITSPGQLKSNIGSIEVKTPAAGKVEKLFYEDGQNVKAGDLLVQFDVREATKEKSTLINLISLEKQALESKEKEYISNLNSIESTTKILEKRLKTRTYILSQMTKLVELGGYQEIQYLQEKDQVFELETQLNEIKEDKNKLYLALNQQRIDSAKQIDQLQNRLNGILVKLQYQNVKAPKSGIIFNSNAYAGGVLNSGETIVSIVPQEGLKAEVFVPNKDIGYIKLGKPVKVRVDAFPFARYGELSGIIKTIGADALPPDRNYNYYRFPITISLDKSYLEVKDSKIPLKPGMAITANLKLRDKRVVSLVSDIFSNQTDSLRYLRQQ